MSGWHPKCLHYQKELLELHYAIGMSYWLTQIISIFKCCRYQYLGEGIGKCSSVPEERQTSHPIPRHVHTSWTSTGWPNDDASRQNVGLDVKSCFGQVVSTKEWQTRLSGWQEDRSSSESLMRDLQKSGAIQGGKMLVRFYAALQEANTSQKYQRTNSVTINLHCKTLKGTAGEKYL